VKGKHSQAARRGRPKSLGESITIGPIGPIPVVADDTLASARSSARIAQLATTCNELVALVLHNPDAIVRMEAVPRLKARFSNDPNARDALLRAVSDPDGAVRCAAIGAVAELAIPGANDVLAERLADPLADVRYFAAVGLQDLGDPRAPDDPEAFAYDMR
jgi:HEAT repeat protein